MGNIILRAGGVIEVNVGRIPSGHVEFRVRLVLQADPGQDQGDKGGFVRFDRLKTSGFRGGEVGRVRLLVLDVNVAVVSLFQAGVGAEQEVGGDGNLSRGGVG